MRIVVVVVVSLVYLVVASLLNVAGTVGLPRASRLAIEPLSGLPTIWMTVVVVLTLIFASRIRELRLRWDTRSARRWTVRALSVTSGMLLIGAVAEMWLAAAYGMAAWVAASIIVLSVAVYAVAVELARRGIRGAAGESWTPRRSTDALAGFDAARARRGIVLGAVIGAAIGVLLDVVLIVGALSDGTDGWGVLAFVTTPLGFMLLGAAIASSIVVLQHRSVMLDVLPDDWDARRRIGRAVLGRRVELSSEEQDVAAHYAAVAVALRPWQAWQSGVFPGIVLICLPFTLSTVAGDPSPAPDLFVLLGLVSYAFLAVAGTVLIVVGVRQAKRIRAYAEQHPVAS